MNETAPAAARPQPESERLELKPFLLAAMLWLPLAFFLWFGLRSAVVYPVIGMADATLGWLLPGLVTNVHQEYHQMLFSVVAPIGKVGALPSERLLVDLSINVLPYCYGVAVLMGLSIATPISWARTFLQIGVGCAIMSVLQAFGLVGEVMKKLAFEIGPAVHAALIAEGFPNESGMAATNAAQATVALLAEKGIGLELIALWYQFGFLIIPSISAVILWILFNRRFIEGLRPPPRRPVRR